MGLFRRGRGGYIDHSDLSRREAYSCALFVLAAAVVVAKLAEPEFDRIFFVAAGVGVLLLMLTRHRLAYAAAAFAWMGFRFVLGSVFYKDPMLLAWAAGFGAVAWGNSGDGKRHHRSRLDPQRVAD